MRRREHDRGFVLFCQLPLPGFPVFGEAAFEDPLPAEDPGEPEGHGPLDLDLQDAPAFLQQGDPLQGGGEIQVLRPVSGPPVDGEPQVPAGLEVGRAVVDDEAGGPQTGIMVPEVGELPADLSVPRDLLSREEALRLEARIKKLKRPQKTLLAAGDEALASELIAGLGEPLKKHPKRIRRQKK